MEIEVKKLNQQKKYNGTFSFLYEADDDLVTIPFAKFAEAVKTEGAYEILEDLKVHIQANVTFTVTGLCTRCMEPAEAQVTTTIDEVFLTQDDGESYTYQKGVIDLTEAVRDAILDAMPFKLLCREDCPGIEYDE